MVSDILSHNLIGKSNNQVVEDVTFRYRALKSAAEKEDVPAVKTLIAKGPETNGM
jgi:hypothetical protein